jgi:predicted nucleic acid-binding protein
MRAGHEEVLDFVAHAEIVLLPVTVLGELEGAFQLGARSRENRVTLASFLEEPFVSVLFTTFEVARRYGQLYAVLRRAGTPVPANDIWIAAATVDCGGRLLTFDTHFALVESLDSIILPAGT